LDWRIARAYVERAVVYDNLGAYDQALRDFSRAIELEPGRASTYVKRSVTHAAMGSFKEAVSDCNRALDIDPRFAPAYLARGMASFRAGDRESAKADFERARELDRASEVGADARDILDMLEEQPRSFGQFEKEDPLPDPRGR
jgi:tetratricopeptide (TPR) repeat protein